MKLFFTLKSLNKYGQIRKIGYEKDVIGFANNPYLTRRIFHFFSYSIRLHKFSRGDSDRHLHDHPFSFVTIPLNKGYWEINLDNEGKRKKEFVPLLALTFREAEHLHSIIDEIKSPVWTLVFTGPRRRNWGFQTEDGWVEWEKYDQKFENTLAS